MPRQTLIVLLLAYLAFMSLGLPDTVLGVAWPSLRARFDIPQPAMGAVLAAGMSGYFLSGLWAGAAVERLGVGGLLAASSALVAAALFGFALAPSFVVFFPIGAVMGLGSGAIDSGLNAHAARHFSARHVNWLHGCWGIGASIGPALMTFAIAEGHGYRAGYALLGGVLGSMAVLFLLTRQRWGARSAVPSGAAPAGMGAGAPVGVRIALRSGRVWLQVLAFFLYTGLESSTGQWCFSWLRERGGLSVEAAGGWTSAYWASLTTGRLVIGLFVDRVGPDRLLRWAIAFAVLGSGSFAAGSAAWGGAGLLLLGMSLAPIFPTLMAQTPSRVGDSVAHHAIGFQVSAATLGSTLLPTFTGALVARWGLGVLGAVLLGAGAALLLVHEALIGVTRRSPPGPLLDARDGDVAAGPG